MVAERGESISSVVERYFEYLVPTRWVDALAEELGLGVLKPTTSSEIPSRRLKGLDAARIVRELRESRGGRVAFGGA